MNSATLERVLSAPRIPSLPAVAMKVIDLTEDPNVSLKDIAQTIQNDQGLAAKILRTVNSSFYGLTKKCSTISQAMVALGLNAVKSLALGFSLVSMIKEGEGAEFDYVDYWRRGVYSAVGARVLAARVKGLDPEEAFLGAILQDVGMIALYQALGRKYLEVIRATGGDHRELCKHEVRQLELQHTEVGAMLAQRWKLPESLVAPIRYHERPTAAPQGHAALVQTVGLANIAADVLTGSGSATLQQFYARSEQWLGMSAADADVALKKIGEGARELATLLKVQIGEMSNTEEILARASERLVQMTLQAETAAEELAKKNASLQREAVTDTLTGVANRRRFNEEVSAAFEHAKSSGGAMSVIFIDADKFKSVNDTHGHQAGDAVLVSIAGALTEHFSPCGALVCRYGGEEFAVILPGADRTEAARVAEEFRSSQAERDIDLTAAGASEPMIRVTVSMGVAGIDPACADAFAHVEQLIRVADQAVYAAKGSGRNCVRVFNPRLKPAA
ncbi:MAG: HDOD domain-containing protein [Phycisphaerales bacterium]